MRRLVPVLLCTLLLSGCSTLGHVGSRALPWNWFTPNRSAAIATQQDKREVDVTKLTKQAQISVETADKILSGEPTPSQHVSDAKVELDRAKVNLSLAAGPLTPEQNSAIVAIVSGLQSQVLTERDRALQAEKSRDQISVIAAKDIAARDEKIDSLTAKQKKTDADNAAQAEKYRQLKYLIFGIVGFFVFGNALLLVLRNFPATAGISQVLGTVLSPAVQTGKNKLSSAISSVVHDSAELKDKLVSAFSAVLDDHDKVSALGPSSPV